MVRFLVVLILYSVSAGAQRSTFFGLNGSSVPCVGGPPTFSCATQSILNPGNVIAPFVSTAPTASTCSGMCQNSTAEDLTIPGHIRKTQVITRITDGSTVMNGGAGGSVGNLTCSGGDNDRMISKNGTYLGVSAGGAAAIYHLSQAGGKVQVVNSGAPPGISVACSIGFSWTVDTRFYFIAGTSGAEIHQADITSDSTYTNTLLVDLMAAGVCPGVTPFTVADTAILGISDDDDKFSGVFAPGVQGTADWAWVWSRTLGCATVNFKTGAAYAFCLAPSTCDNTTVPVGTMPAGATNCWGSDGSTTQGIHDTQMTGDGLYQNVSRTGSWTQGGCNTGLSGYVFWQIGTTGNQWCQNQGAGNIFCGAHQSNGISHLLTPGSGNTPVTGPTIHTVATLGTLTTFYPPPAIQDFHCSWPHTNGGGTFDDNQPWICAGDTTLTSQGTVGVNGCTSAVYCPNFQANSIWAIFPTVTNKVVSFAHTFACGAVAGGSNAQCADGIVDPFGAGNAIGVVSPKGDFFCWASSMMHQMGNDNLGAGHPRADAFCMMLQ